MIKVDYLMTSSLVDQFVETKEAIISARNSMSAKDVADSKTEILDSCNIYAVDEETGLADYEVRDGIAFIPVYGMLVQSVDICSAFFGETITTYGFIQEAAIDADSRADVTKIAFVVSSGGGVVSGIDSTSEVIRNLVKPTVSIVHEMAASAAYWIPSQTDEIIGVSKTGFYGSIGVVTELIDRSGQEKADGISRYVVTNTESKNKRPDITTDEGMQVVVDRLDSIQDVFVSSVLLKRAGKLDREKIKELNGKVVIAEKALSIGLIDKLMTLSEAESYIAGSSISYNSAVGGENKKTEVTMNFNELMDSNPRAKAEYRDLIAAAKTEGMEAGMNEAKVKESARVAEILDLDSSKVSESAMAAIRDGQDSGEFAKAALKSGRDSIKAEDNTSKIAGVSVAKEPKDDVPKESNDSMSIAAGIVAGMKKNKRG